jgi:hypothetical protein
MSSAADAAGGAGASGAAPSALATTAKADERMEAFAEALHLYKKVLHRNFTNAKKHADSFAGGADPVSDDEGEEMGEWMDGFDETENVRVDRSITAEKARKEYYLLRLAVWSLAQARDRGLKGYGAIVASVLRTQLPPIGGSKTEAFLRSIDTKHVAVAARIVAAQLHAFVELDQVVTVLDTLASISKDAEVDAILRPIRAHMEHRKAKDEVMCRIRQVSLDIAFVESNMRYCLYTNPQANCSLLIESIASKRALIATICEKAALRRRGHVLLAVRKMEENARLAHAAAAAGGAGAASGAGAH